MDIDTKSMQGKTCLVTGGSSGIGKAMAMGLAQRGANVVLLCRNRERGMAAQREIKEKSGNPSVELLLGDLASKKAIQQAAQEFKAKYAQLHVLINNAGGVSDKRVLTEDGFEQTFGVNHLAPFLLTHLLLDLLKASAPSRIITVASEAQETGKIEFDDLQREKKYSMFGAYSQSKLSNILFTFELAKRLQGTGVTANYFHPGLVRTNFGRNTGWLIPAALFLLGPIVRTPEKGAETGIYLASEPGLEGVTGKYFIDKADASRKARYDQATAERLWDVSEKLVLKGNEGQALKKAA